MSSSCCPACQSRSNSYICPACLTKLLKLYKGQTSSHSTTLLPAAQARAKTGIAINKENRELEAIHYARKRNVAAISDELAKLRRDIDKDLDSVRKKRAHLQARKERLGLAREAVQAASKDEAGYSTAKPVLPALSNLLQHDHQLQADQQALCSELAETHRILLREALEAFDVKLSGNEGCRYAMSGLPVPPLRALQSLPRHQLNATLQLLLHLLRLASMYLSIKFPFALSGTVSKPLIRPVSGSSNAARYAKSYLLYASSSSASSSSNTQASSTSSSVPNGGGVSHAQALSTGLRMLAYNVYYLLYTSFLNTVPTDIQDDADDILAMLVRTSEVTTFGFRSHSSLRPGEALRDTELPSGHDFASFVKLLDKKQEQPFELDKRKGTYVVVEEAQKEDIDPFVVDSKEEEGWDLL